jgi:hypothetical protein
VNRFGRRLFQIFFETYTEKVWGRPCSEIGADWAAQRIKNLDLVAAVRNALIGNRADGKVVTTLIDRSTPGSGRGCSGSGERAAGGAGRRDRMQTRAVRSSTTAGGRAVETERPDGSTERIEGEHFIFDDAGPRARARHSVPLLPVRRRGGGPASRTATSLTVVLIVEAAGCFPDKLGSTSIRRMSGWVASRTSRTGARTWCPIPLRFR